MATNERLHIGIMGAGAIGGYVGARLAAKGETEVTLIGRKGLADTIARQGVTLRELDHDEHVDPAMVHIEEDVHALSSCDVVFCCVKSGATAETAKILAKRPRTHDGGRKLAKRAEKPGGPSRGACPAIRCSQRSST